MAIRGGKAVTFKPRGLTDAIDGTSAFAGAMSSLVNLVPNPSNDSQFVPRPAAAQLSNFSGFTTPAQGTALLILGTRAYGMIASARNTGKDEPFCYDISAAAFIAIGNVTAGNTPSTQPTTGDWTPPTMVASTNGRITITHPGYNGSTTFIGWIDISSFSSTGITGTTHTSTTIDTLSTNVLQAGWQVGYLVAGTGVQAGTYIVSIAADGLSVVLSLPTTSGGSAVALTVTGGTPAAPIYNAGNTNGNPLTAVPTCAGIYSSRTWYGVKNAAVFSDTLNPQQITNATQVLILGDSTNITALVGLPLSNQVTGGSVQALIAFKGAQTLFQITGDEATMDLAQNAINGSVGTLAPNTICATTKGLAYIAPDGLRVLGFNGTVGDPIGRAGTGVHVPFTNTLTPTRMAAAFNNNVIRISCQPATGAQSHVEYFYDFDRGVWSGPHTFPLSIVKPYYGGSADQCIGFAVGVDAKLWQVAVEPSLNSTYTENGVALAWSWQPTLFPDNQEMSGNQVVESSMAFALPAAQNLSVLAMDEEGNQLDLITIQGIGNAGAVWGGFNWGAATWGPSVGAFEQVPLQWHQPLVFKQMSIRVSGASIAGAVIGNLYVKVQSTGYLLK